MAIAAWPLHVFFRERNFNGQVSPRLAKRHRDTPARFIRGCLASRSWAYRTAVLARLHSSLNQAGVYSTKLWQLRALWHGHDSELPLGCAQDWGHSNLPAHILNYVKAPVTVLAGRARAIRAAVVHSQAP